MKVLICCPDPEDKRLAAFASRSLWGAPVECVADSAFSRGIKKKAPDSFVYFDSSLGRERIAAFASKLDEIGDCAWGVIDSLGETEDPSAYFFEGASDYIGPALFKEGLGPGRFERTLDYAGLGEEGDECPAKEGFPGWSELEDGEEVSVRFCYAAIGNQAGLLERIGEKRLDKLREDFAAFLESWAKECSGLVWMKETEGCLLLFPPEDDGMNPVLAAFRLLLDRVLVGYEVFKLEVPLTFRFAFHAGRTMWKKRGSTGEIVSEDVNFVFHLGMKAAGDGYILLSSKAARSVPGFLSDLFAPAGEFEGRSLIASRRFKD